MEITKTEKKSHVFAVAPHAGAWIEIILKRSRLIPIMVAPHAGAWIEMEMIQPPISISFVAPHAGAWIEMSSTVLSLAC